MKLNHEISSEEADEMQSSDEENSENEGLSRECELTDEADKSDSQNEEFHYAKRKNEDIDGESPKKKKHKTGKDLFKPPTAKEITQLKETQNLFHSNIFRLQIDEMLKEVNVKEKCYTLTQQWLDDLRNYLDQMKDSEEFELNQLSFLETVNVNSPIKMKPESVKGKFQFRKPICINFIGSWRTKCTLGPKVKIDISIEMPKNCFQKSDNTNQKYHRKRALYLAYIVSHLQKSDLVEEIKYFHWIGNELKPVAEIRPFGKLSKYVTVLLHVSAPINTFKLIRFSPPKSNVRSAWFFEDNEAEESQNTEFETPHYNAGVLSDMTMTVNNDYLEKLLTPNNNVCDGIKLLKVWLRQRELDQGFGSFNGYVLSMFVAYLLQTRKLNNSMSSYQVARFVWNTIAQSDWVKNGITLAPEETDLPLSIFHNHYEVVFVDTTGFYNICADMPQEVFYKVKHEAELAVKFLDSNHTNSFQALFMSPLPFHLQHDHLIRIHGESVMNSVTKFSTKPIQLDWSHQVMTQMLALVLPILRRGLGNRVSTIGIKLPSYVSWLPDQNYPMKTDDHLVIGLTLNKENAFNVLEMGPAPNLPEAEEFKKFWGDKAELRRFKDGTITEAVLWPDTETLADKRVLCSKIVQYLLKLYLGIETDSGLMYVANQLERVLSISKVQPYGYKYGTGEESTLAVLKAYNELSKQLHQMKNLPLDISSVQGISAVFHYCEAFPPISSNHRLLKNLCKEADTCIMFIENCDYKRIPMWVLPMEVVISLSMSGKWPDDLEALRRIQAAFIIKIAQCLKEQFSLVAHPYQDYVDVLKGGYVFRLRIGNNKEIALLKQRVSPLGVLQFRDNEESIALENLIVFLPKLNSALHGLHQQFSSFGPTCCLAKRWLRSQLLDSSHIPDIVIELLVSSLFLCPEPYEPLLQPQPMFFRFLRFMANTDWQTHPIVLNFNSEIDDEGLVAIEKHFYSMRSSLPALFVATPFDKMKSIWTKDAPSIQILIRIAVLATEALNILEKFSLSDNSIDFKAIFRPSMEMYDVIIYLNPSLNPRRNQIIDVKVDKPIKVINPYKPHPKEKIPIVDFDPVQCYLQELRDNFGSFALFFHDTYGGMVIGVLWKPNVKEEKIFKVANIKGMRPANKNSEKLVVNIEAFIEDFSVLGADLVTRIYTKPNN